MNSPLLEMEAAAARIAAFRQARARQCAVGFRGGLLHRDDFLLTGSRSFECLFRALDPGDDFSNNQFLFASWPNVRAPRAYVQKGYLVVGMTNDIVVVDPLEIGPWHHLVETVDADTRTLTVWLDGALAGVKALKEELQDNEGLYIGSWNAVLKFRGDIALVRAYAGVLTDTQAAQLWNDGDPAAYVVPDDLKTDCRLELLAQNFDGTSWRDSAPQHPAAGYLPPLLESAGGLDFPASGALEVVF